MIWIYCRGARIQSRRIYMKTYPIYGADILSAAQFTRESLETVLSKAREMKSLVQSGRMSDDLKGKIMTALFYEPSSRTFGSFISAMQRLGGGIVPLQGVTYSSVSKGETLEDTVQTFAGFSDVLVLRYPHVGGAKIAADAIAIPVINAGDGNGEHPTQALLDMFTISGHFESFDGLTVTMVGDLLNGRTVHSLVQLLALHSPKQVNFVAPSELQIPEVYTAMLKNRGIEFAFEDSLTNALPETDVLYVTRVQKERFRDLDLYERLKHHYVISKSTLIPCKSTMILMHPFPRVGEIATDVDSDPRALYLREQIPNGMYVRMALLSLLLKK